MLSVEGKVFNVDGKTVPVAGEQRFVLNFTVSQYLGKSKKDGKAMYRSFAVSVWDKRGENLQKSLQEKAVVAIKSDHYKAEAYEGRDGLSAKIKIELWANDKLDVLHKPDDGQGGDSFGDDDFAESSIAGGGADDDVPF